MLPKAILGALHGTGSYSIRKERTGSEAKHSTPDAGGEGSEMSEGLHLEVTTAGNFPLRQEIKPKAMTAR
jgi:hypothetical protein